MISPSPLKVGDAIGIVAPARKMSPSELAPAITLFESWGLRVVLGKNLYGEHHQFSGSDRDRAADIQAMIDDPSVRAIICARGGYGTVRVLEHVNFRPLQFDPKWIVGYSDVTVLHSYLNMWFSIETLHATMPINFPLQGESNASTESLREALFGKVPTYAVQSHALNREGAGVGQLTGGNLSVLSSLRGTDADIYTDGRILFIEDLDEYLYHVDRMLMNLKRSGRLKGLAGLVVGGFSDMHDNQTPFGYDAYTIINQSVREFDFPVCFGFPAGHQEPNMALLMGRKATLSVTVSGVRLEFLPAGQ